MLARLFVGSLVVELPAALLPGESQSLLHLCTSLAHLPIHLSTCSEVTLSTRDLSVIMMYKPYGAQSDLKPIESIQYLHIILRKRPF